MTDIPFIVGEDDRKSESSSCAPVRLLRGVVIEDTVIEKFDHAAELEVVRLATLYVKRFI